MTAVHQCPTCSRYFADAELLGRHRCALAAVERVIRAETNHTATGDDLHDLAQLHAERMQLEARIQRRVTSARTAGVSWSDIGGALDVSKQAAQQRYGVKPQRIEHDPAQYEIAMP